MKRPHKLLIVDDNLVDRRHIRRLLGDEYLFFEADDVKTGLEVCERERPDCVLLDYLLPRRDGLSALGEFTALGAPVIMLTGEGAEEVAVQALKSGASDYLVKGSLSGASLIRAIQTAGLLRTVRDQREELKSNEGRLFRLLEGIPAGVFVMAADGTPTYANAAAEEIMGRELLPSTTAEQFAQTYRLFVAGTHEYYPTEDLPFFRALHGQTHTVNNLEVQRDRRVRIMATGSPVYDDEGKLDFAVVLFRDVTEQVELERQLMQAQKMEAVGRLAGGVAHDFNNLLTAILSFGEFVLRGLEEGSQMHQDQKEVLRAAERARTLTNQLLAFSRNQPVRPVVSPLDQVLEGSHRMLQRILGEDIQVSLNLKPAPDGGEPWNVRVDPSAFEQVVLNLSVNARDAMPDGGSLTLEIDYISEVLDEQSMACADVEPGNYVVLSVTDSGVGIERHIQEHIFEPFFTTKSSEKGTGLGLATCYGIVRQAGGTICVESTVGKGTTFRVYLPRAKSPTAGLSPLPPQTDSAIGSETIVVAEDNDAVRKVVIRTLAEAGYRVLSYPLGTEALAAIQRRDGPISLLLTDVIMPQMSGRQLADKAQRLLPDLKVLFMSGYTQSAIEHHGVLSEHVELIQKPFAPEALLARVRRIIDADLPPRKTFSTRVLYIDAEGHSSSKVVEQLNGDNEVVRVVTGASALELLRQQDFEVIVCDGRLSDYSARDFYNRCIHLNGDLAHRLIFISGALGPGETKSFFEQTQVAVLYRPLDGNALREELRFIVDKHGQSSSRIRIEGHAIHA